MTTTKTILSLHLDLLRCEVCQAQRPPPGISPCLPTVMEPTTLSNQEHHHASLQGWSLPSSLTKGTTTSSLQ